ncbi:MAG: VWA domain-containing protein [Vicinamibacterales bacterium]
MLPRIGFGQITFGAPEYLWLLVVPALLFAAWVWRLLRRRADFRGVSRHRLVPRQSRFAVVGELPFWLCLILSLIFIVIALARPHGPAIALRQGGMDLVVLLDGSASMRVKDVPGDRWQRSTRFLRMLGDSMSWQSDRIALAVFARIAAPQIRLTKDPNTFLFFLDNLEQSPPFRLEDDSTWDTNLELGIHWGLRLIEKDQELHGPSSNARIFLMISDGEAWSGEVEKSLQNAIDANIPLFVVGAGTLAGGLMPKWVPKTPDEEPDPETPLISRLDRQGLQKIASAGGGQYFELDRDGDRRIANALIDAAKRRAPSIGVTEQAEELYWRFLVLAAALAMAGALFLRERVELWILLVGGTSVLFALSGIIG